MTPIGFVLLSISTSLAMVPVQSETIPSPTFMIGESSGSEPAVRLAEVSSQVRPGQTELANIERELRREVEVALRAVDWNRVEVMHKRILVSASVTQLTSSRRDNENHASCTVSAALRYQKDGAVFAFVQGSGQAADGASGTSEAERGAITGAARGIVAAIPRAAGHR